MMKDHKPRPPEDQGFIALVIVVVVFGGLFVYELLKWSAK
jgi:hypothetical protein